ncbi:PAS domain S-box protein [Methanospirillum stamsii]|uniref:PAS domain S-box protein n=1 Tax=Methanospirillum stamsii TaxID=1277351 RepID=UPI0024822B93|nr:PAS domain S-box protein [Methanospirillum stamsii]
MGDPKQFTEITRLFSENGAKLSVSGASDIKDAITKLQVNHYDVVVGNFDLGKENGLDFIARVKKQIQYSPVTIFIGEQAPSVVKEAIKSGIDYFFLTNDENDLELVRLNTFIRQTVKNKQAEESLHYADTNFRTIVEATDDSIYMIDRHYRYLFINSPHQKRLGIFGEDYESKLYKDLHTEDETRRFINSMNQVITNNDYFYEEYEKDGRYYSRKFIPVRYQTSQQTLAVTVVSIDITDRVRLEDEISRGTSLVTATFESTSDGIFVVDRSGKIINYNQKFLDMWFIPETVIEERDEEVLLAFIEDQLEDRKTFIEKLNYLKAHPDKEAFDVLEFRDGRIFERNTLPQRIGGTIIGRVWSFRDVTEQRKTLSSLQVTQANYRSVVESTGDSIFMVDSDGCYLFMNSYHKSKLGDIAERYLENRMRVMLPPGEETRFDQAVERVLSTKRQVQDEFRWMTKDYIRRFTPVSEENTNEVRAVTVVLTDISDWKAAEQEVKNNEERLKILFDLAPEAYLLTDIKGTFIESNRAATDLTGFTPDDLRGRNIFTMGLIGSMHITKTAVLFAKNALGKPTGPDEVHISRKDGKILYAEVMTYPIRIRTQNLVMTIARDITERKAAEEALKQREEQYRLLVNNAGEAVFVIRETRIIFANPKSSIIFGYDQEQLINSSLLDIVHSDDQEEFLVLLQRAMQGEQIHAGISVRGYTASGELRWLEVGMAEIVWQNKSSVLLLCMDVTKQKIAQDALVQSNRKLNLLSSITRHDVLNQITILLAYLDLLKKKNKDPELEPFIGKQVEATQAIRSQIVFTKEYQDVGVKEPQWQNLGSTIAAASEYSRTEFVSWDNRLNSIDIYADPLLEKVFSNLISNSVMHGESVNEIRFFTEEKSSGLTLVYEDNGIGIPDKDKKKIFHHGFGKNTGFGLFLSREILSITGLSITETGKEGKGVRFEIFIPRNLYRLM